MCTTATAKRRRKEARRKGKRSSYAKPHLVARASLAKPGIAKSAARKK